MNKKKKQQQRLQLDKLSTNKQTQRDKRLSLARK